jgi:hypothetical protein
MNNALKTAARAALALIVALTVGMVGAVLFARQAHAQVTDAPITTMHTEWTGVVHHVTGTSACVAGWSVPSDKYSAHKLRIAFVDMTKLSAAGQLQMIDALNAGTPAVLAAMRTDNFRVADERGVMVVNPMARPCFDKLKPPRPRWIVAPLESGKRPAYLLLADGTRGRQAGYVDTTITGNGRTAANACLCSLRSKETTSSTYCAPAWFAPPSTEAAPIPTVVTLCRQG